MGCVMQEDRPQDEWHGIEPTFAQWETENGWVPKDKWEEFDLWVRRVLVSGGALLVWLVIAVFVVAVIKGDVA